MRVSIGPSSWRPPSIVHRRWTLPRLSRPEWTSDSFRPSHLTLIILPTRRSPPRTELSGARNPRRTPHLILCPECIPLLSTHTTRLLLPPPLHPSFFPLASPFAKV